MIASLQLFRPDPVNLDCLVQIYNVSFLMLELNTAQMTVCYIRILFISYLIFMNIIPIV